MTVTTRQVAVVEGMAALHDNGFRVSSFPPDRANAVRLQAELDFLYSNPSRHKQSSYVAVRREENVCDTAACLAGWTTIHEADANPNSEVCPIYLDVETGVRLDEVEVTRPGSLVDPSRVELYPAARQVLPAVGGIGWGRGRRDWHEAGQKLLGLNDAEAEVLFWGENTLEEMYAFAALITDGAVVDPYQAKAVAA